MSRSETQPTKEVSGNNNELTTLLHNVNISSTSARFGWISFLTLSAILFVILAAVKDYNLLLNTPVIIPLINLSVPMKTFFLVMPGIYIFAHFSILLQNVLLAQKVEIFDTNTSNLEDLHKVAIHPIRFQLNSYFMTQVIAGPTRHRAIGRYLDDISWLSLTVLPQLVLIYFFLTYLPYHDIFSTWVHRFYILLDILVILTISTYFTAPLLSFSGALWDSVKYYPFRTLFSSVLVAIGLFFTFAVATIPGEVVERKLLYLNALAPSFIVNTSEDSFFLTSLIFGDKNASKENQRIGLFRRNLYLTDRNINELQKTYKGERRVNLRERDLRYATFNRSNIMNADFTRARLQGASFKNSSLKGGVFKQTILDGTRFIQTNLNGAQFQKAKIFGANFTRSSLYSANFSLAGVIGSNFSNAKLAGANFNDTKLHGSHFYKADLRAATFINSWLTGVSFSEANLLGADLHKGTVWESVPSIHHQFIDLSMRKLKPPTAKEIKIILRGLNQIYDTSLRKKLVSTLSPVLNKESATNWVQSFDYRQWKNLIALDSRQEKGATFKNKLSTRLANISCSETAKEAYLTTSIVKRITATYLQQPVYNGNAKSYLTQVVTQNCPAFKRVNATDRQKILDLVLQGGNINDLFPQKAKPVPITQVQPAPVPENDSVANNTDTPSVPIQ